MPPITIAELLTDLSSLKACDQADAVSLVTIEPSLLPVSLRTQDTERESAALAAAKELIDLHVEISQRRGMEDLAGGKQQVQAIVQRVQEKI